MHTKRIPQLAIMLAAITGFGSSCSEPTAPLTKGSLRITVAGPPGAPAVITVLGPTGQGWDIAATTTLTDVDTGTYQILTANVPVGTATYGAWPSDQSVTVVASKTTSVATVTYVRVDAVLDLTISGLPADLMANVSVTGGPDGFSASATGSQSFPVIAGTYTVTALIVSQGGIVYGGTEAFHVLVPPSLTTPFRASVTYVAIQTGQLTLTVTTPAHTGVSGSLIAISGPYNYHRTLKGDTTLTDIPLGIYSVTSFKRCFTGVLHPNALCGPGSTAGRWYYGTPSVQGGTITAASPLGVTHVAYISPF